MEAQAATPDAAQPQQDANWAALVNGGQNVPSANQNAAPADDPKWNDLVKSYAHPTEQPETPTTPSEFAQKLAQPLVNFAVKQFMPPPQEQESADDKELNSFRNSKDYLGSQQNFMDMVTNAVIKPAVSFYVNNNRAYQQQVSMANESLAQATTPLTPETMDTGEPFTTTLKRGLLDIPGALIQQVAARTGVSPAIQLAAEPFVGRERGAEIGAQIGMLPAFAFGEHGQTDPNIQVRNAVNSGVFKGEDAYFNEPSTTPVPEITPETKAEVPAFDIHSAARNVAPETFAAYDPLLAKQETLRNQLNDLTEQRTAALDTQIKDIQEAKQGNYGKLQTLIAKRNEIASHDTPQMAEVRQQIQQNDYAMRDLAPKVSEAYRAASEFAPEERVPEALPETQHTGAEQGLTPQKPIEEQRQAIVDDITPKIMAAGRPQEEANAVAQLEAARYQSLSEQYPKFSAEEWYNRESANIKAGKERATVLAQGEKGTELNQIDSSDKINTTRGKIRLATDDEKATITLMKNANASTLIHEKGHEWTDQLLRLSGEDDAPDQLKKDAETLRKYGGASEDGVLPTRGHEKIARGFERYLMEGTAPNRELAGVFAKFKQWLTKIYQTVEKLRSPISDDIRDVFDRFLASKPEKTVLAPDHEPGAMLAHIHETDAAETPPEKAAPVADNIRNEIKSTAKIHGDKEAENVITTAETGGGSGNPPSPESAAGNTASEAPEKISASRNTASAQGGIERIPRKPASLIDWIKKQGGIKDDGGEIASFVGKEKGRTRDKIIRADGTSLDDLALRAHEAGYFTGNERPDINTLIEKIREDYNGNPQYSIHDVDAVESYNNALARNAETDRLTHEFGIDTNGKTSTQIYDEIASHMSQERQAAEAKEIGEAFEKELAEAQKIARSEALEPEEIAHEGISRTLEDLENERQQEIAARGAQGSPTGAGQSEPAAGGAGEVQGGDGQGGRSSESTRRTEPQGSDASPDAAGAAAIESRRATERDAAGEPTQSPETNFGKGKPYYVNDKGVINFDLFKTPEDIQRYLQEWSDRNPDKINEARGGVVTLDQTAKLAESMGMTTKDLLSRKVGELYDGPKQVAAAQLFIQSSKRIKETADAARASGNPQKVADFLSDLEDHKDFMDMFLQQVGISAEASRALGSRRAIRKLGGFEEAMNIGELFQRMTGTNMKDAKAQAELFASLENPSQVAKLAQKTREASWFDYAIAYRNNNLLSGPVTHLHYLDGNILNLLYRPLKTAVASLIPGGPKLGEAGAMWSSMTLGAQKGWQVAKAAWNDGVDRSFDDTVQNYKNPTQVSYNPVFDKYLGANSPVGRSIRAIHSFTYTMNYEQDVASLAYRQALKEGLEENSPDFNNRISDLITKPTDDMVAAADKSAKRSVYMANPEWGTTLSTFNQFANRTPVGRFLFPFAKMEMNVKSESLLNNTALGVFSKDVRANLMGVNGPEARAIQIAGMGMGTSMAGLVFAMGDHINGNGPSNQNERKVWLLTHTPNSIQIGDVSIPLRALGNVGQILMMGAELKETYHDMTDEQAKNTAAMFMEHVSRAAFGGTFIQSVSDVANAWSNPVQYGDQFLKNTASGFVPYATLLSQTNRYIDPFQRDVHSAGMANLYGITDSVKSHIPFVSQTMQPRVDVLGNPIPNDHWLAAGSYDQYLENPAVQKLQSIGMGLSMAKRDIMSVPLNDKQYNDYAVTSGTLIQQRLWNTDGYGVLQEPGFDALSQASKRKEISEAVKSAREAARAQMIFMYPEIMDQAVAKKTATELQ